MHLFVQIHPLPNQRLPQSFEGLVDALSDLPGMCFEMDGSFVWVDQKTSPHGQMDAMVYDRDGKLEYVEVKGPCSPAQWQSLCLSICGHETVDGDEANFNRLIDPIIRVHQTQIGEWTTASEIFASLVRKAT